MKLKRVTPNIYRVGLTKLYIARSGKHWMICTSKTEPPNAKLERISNRIYGKLKEAKQCAAFYVARPHHIEWDRRQHKMIHELLSSMF